jgi:hypothetical protein
MTWILNQDGDRLINLDLCPRVLMGDDGKSLMVGGEKVAHCGNIETLSDLFWTVCEMIRDGSTLVNLPDMA